MTYANQFDYDNALPPADRDYRDELLFADFIEDVTLKLLSGRNQYGIDSEILLIDLELAAGGYQMASEIVSDRVTERDYREWLND
ncbi:MAG TPA: hypothetical protein PLZ58_03980 [Candidatus Saccharibacteria bacterium]|nr:hypothetical protein [Candidatus Saccharibacteria bacterium]